VLRRVVHVLRWRFASDSAAPNTLVPFGMTTPLRLTLHDRENVGARLARLYALLNELETLCAQSVDIRVQSRRTHDELRRATDALRPVTRGLFGERESE
jgi:hypothetical protein